MAGPMRSFSCDLESDAGKGVEVKRSFIVAIVATLVSASMPALAWWNTGVVEVVNNSGRQISLVFLESSSSGLFSRVPAPAAPLALVPGARLSFGGRIVPWCDNINELRTKAIVVSTVALKRVAARELFRICQNYRDDIVYYVRGDASGWQDRVRCASGPFPYITIVVESNGLPLCKG